MKSDLKAYSLIFKQEGTAQNERYANALNPARVEVDGRKLEDFIVFAQKYTKYIRFVPAAGDVEPVQNWSAFFKDNDVLLMANIATKQIDDTKEAYETLMARFRDEPSEINFIKITALVFSLFKKIDGWYASAAPGTVLNGELMMYIRSYLSRELHKLGDILDYIPAISKTPPGDLSLEILNNKNDVWSLTDKGLTVTSDDLFAGKNQEEKLRNAMVTVDKIFNEGYHAIANIINSSKNYFSTALYQQRNHLPHIALFITFIKLYGHVQDALNALPKKMLDYYYKDVLGIKMHKAIADQAIVVFELVKGFDNYKLDKGTALSAGKDKSGIDIIYKTSKEVFINKAQVSALKSIFIQKNRSGILSYSPKTIKSDGEYIAGDPSLPVTPWSPFGAPNPAAYISVGFGIASSQFYLSKGERRVTLIMELTDAPEFDEIELSLISLRLTGEKGWISSTNVKDSININYFKKVGDKVMEVDFLIAIAQPSAVIAYDHLLHAGTYKTDNPVLEILLQYPQLPTAPKDDDYNKYISKIHQLNFLQTASLSSCEVKVQVGTISDKVNFDGVTDLLLQNHESALDNKKPFMPFTTMPKVGSSFYIGCNDLFYKSIQTLTLNIEWMLPDNFHSYYDKYFPPYDSNKFIASLSVLDNQYWKSIDDVKLIDPYASEPKFRSLIINPQEKELAADAADPKKDVSKFDVSKQNGMLKLKLKYPDFGHDVYPQLITASVMEKATSKMATVDFYKIIKKQLHDSVISIKYPDDIANSAGSMKVVVYDILEKIKDKERARGMIISGLDNKLKTINGSAISFNEIKQLSETMNEAGQNLIIVNDDNFVERIFRFLRKVKLIDKSIHFDEDKQNVGAVVESINDNINKHVDFILPADQEMVELIISETNSAISKVVVKIADKLLALNAADGPAIAEIFKKEVDDANEVINDLIARKIATLLSAHDVPPKPYTPLINTFAISYVSSRQLNRQEDQFFQVMPFGVKEIFPLGNKAKPNDAGTGKNIFPGYLTVDDDDESKPSGLLFIGIKDILPDQNLSLYFQIEEGSRKSDKEPPKLSWWYLVNNNWLALPDEFLRSDGTFDLQTSGIIEIAIPPNANNANTLFQESGLFWLCAGVTRDIDAFPLVKDVKTQAIAVTFFDSDNVLRLSNTLPMQQIVKMTEKPPAVKSVKQPEASKNGRAMEHETQYYTRVSERLRHKGRAINNWDYERLVLERFPFVYKVKCLNNYAAGQMIAGHVTLIPVVKIAETTGNTAVGYTIPKASYIQLLEIKNFIAAKISPFVTLHVINPQIDYVKVSCKVKFIAGAEKGYYLNKLNGDIIMFLTPWARDNEQSISFSAKIYMSSIINFIDSLSYVDFVSDLVMSQYTLSTGGTENYCRAENQTTALVETQFTTGHSILVSAPEHQIQLF